MSSLLSSSLSGSTALEAPGPAETTRRTLTPRQAATVERLADAAIEELRERRYEGLTVRHVAARAGVAPATAYTYFSSREHLVTELFWRRLTALDTTSTDRRRSPAARAAAVVADVAAMIATEPELAAACTVAMLSAEPDVRLLRDRIAAEIHRRLAEALPDIDDPAVFRALELALSGGLVAAGTGHIAYTDLGDQLGDVARLIIGKAT